MKMLIIEDVNIQANIAKLMMLNACPEASVDIAQDCRTARDCVKNSQYDIILVDFGLPDGDGLHLAREFRDKGVNAYMHTLSGNFDTVPLSEQQAAGLEGGCRKPLSIEKAGEIINSYQQKLAENYTAHS